MPGTPHELPRLYTAAEVAEALRCSTWWVQEQVRRDRVPYCEVAGGPRFTAEHYAAILHLLERQPANEPPATPVRQVRPAVTAREGVPGGLQARVPRRMRGTQSIDTAA
jgi:hypothetical protein